ncbi:exportin-T-like [Clavelina lepadiformis]|uniref:Exportin-T n=1 Tax=Clavelina lepadiformis TaxID=159417 RepID=A0ABP0FNY7_CLALP
MLQTTLEPDVIRGLGPLADPYTHSKAVAYFEQVKSSNQGLEFCATALAQDTYQEDHVNFFLWQVLEHQVKYRYSELSDNIKLGVRKSLLAWIQNHNKCGVTEVPVFLRNKASQVFALVFAKEYLAGWTNFIQDVMLATLGENISNNVIPKFGTDVYLRILLAIDSEVVDRNIDHTSEEQAHNQLLKDMMRERCVSEMVNSWYCVLTFQDVSDESISLCLQVVGAYISWIDINLIANDRFMSLILNYLSLQQETRIRESACDCLKEVSIKGMLPPDKLALIETLWGAIETSGILTGLNDDEEIDFVIKLSRLVSSMISTLIFAWNRQLKSPSETNLTKMLFDSIHAKLPTCLLFFEHEDDDVSAQCIDLVKDYIDMLKRIEVLDDNRKELLEKLFYGLVKKLKYDLEYRFDNEGEDEIEFQDFLRNVKVVFDNFAMLCPELVLENVQSVLTNTMLNWQAASFNDVEVAIRLLYMLGESLPSNLSTQFSSDPEKTSPLHNMMTVLASSGVSNHPHSAVRLQFFETVARYDRYFVVAAQMDQDSTVTVTTAQAFLDHRGLLSNEPKVRSRTAYLFSRFVKTVGRQLSPFAEEILSEIERLVVFSPVRSVERALSSDDQLFIFELAGNLIVSSNFPPQKKAALMMSLLRPLVEGFEPMLAKMKSLAAEELNGPDKVNGPQASEIYATALNYAMSYASRTSKAFSNKFTMSQSGCAQVYTDALKVFLLALDTQVHRATLHTGVRQYLHRMVICLEDEVLPFVPVTIRHILSNGEPRSLHDFIPLLNQIVNKFKKVIEPFLSEVFMLVVRAVFDVLARNSDDVTSQSDDDMKTIRRTYFQFLFALVSNGVAAVILRQAQQDLEMVLSTLIQGATDGMDVVAQKISFSVLTKLIEAWDVGNSLAAWEFATKSVIPACFMAPLHPEFDLKDAQTVLALNESSYLMKAVFKNQGEQLVEFLRCEYLPSISLPQEIIEEYCQVLRAGDNRVFRSYVKGFFTRAKT